MLFTVGEADVAGAQLRLAKRLPYTNALRRINSS